MLWSCSRPKEEQGDEEPKAEEKQEEGDGNESGLDELMLLAGSRRLSEEPDRAGDGEAGGTPQREGPTGEEPQSRDEDEVRSPTYLHTSASRTACFLYSIVECFFLDESHGRTIYALVCACTGHGAGGGRRRCSAHGCRIR